jgi:hypothetical protein
MGTGGAKTISDAKRFNFFHVRNWHGMPLGVWLKALRANGFTVSRPCVPQALRTTALSLVNSALHWADRFVYDRPVARAPDPAPPLFIVGHWRTGTTLLHELMVLDPQFNYPTTYRVMTPHHFLLTECFVPALMNHAMPATRPMDNMEMGFDKPQEDEFALCNLGLPSPYLKWAFPNTDASENALDLDDLSEPERRAWVAGLTRFLRRLAFRDRRRQVLKSPTHTARVGALAAAFPGAQFVHIVRDPRAVFPSTLHTWRQMWSSVAFQVPTFEGVEEYVLSSFERMYRAFERDRPALAPGQLHELRYEDLVRDPVGEVGKIYDRLGLAGFETARPRLEAFAARSKSFRTNTHDLPAELWARIAERWRGYVERYGYAAPAARTGTGGAP